MPQRNATTPWSIEGGRRCTIGWDHSFAEPVSLSSPVCTDLRLPATASTHGFDLLAFRARRKRQTRRSQGGVQEVMVTSKPQFAEISFSTFPQPFVQPVEKSQPQLIGWRSSAAYGIPVVGST